jgi:hypothetical protein
MARVGPLPQRGGGGIKPDSNWENMKKEGKKQNFCNGFLQ